MKGKFKGKILNLRNIIVSLIIVVMAAVSGISIVQYNSRNVQTNLGKSIIVDESINDNNRDIIQGIAHEAASRYNGQATYSGGCSGFVDSVLKGAGLMNNYQPNSDVWYNHMDTIQTYLKDGYNINLIAENKNYFPDEDGNEINWSEVLGSNTIKPGDILCGQCAETDKDGNILYDEKGKVKHLGGHMAIFLGKADSLDNLNNKSYIKDQKFKNIKTIKATNGYWLAYVPDLGEKPLISAYGKLFRSNETKKKRCNQLRVYRITKKTPDNTKYSIRLRKNSGSLGATFSVNNQDVNVTNNGSYTTVKNIDNIDSNGDVKVNSEGTDTYTIYEKDAPKGYNNDHGENSKIVIKVNKVLKDNKYQIGSISVNGIQRGIDGDSTQIYNDGKLIINAHGVGATSDGKYNGVGVIDCYFIDTIEPPKTNNYSITLNKTDENGIQIPSASFTTSCMYTTVPKYLYPIDEDDTYSNDALFYHYNFDKPDEEFTLYWKKHTTIIDNQQVNSGNYITSSVPVGTTDGSLVQQLERLCLTDREQLVKQAGPVSYGISSVWGRDAVYIWDEYTFSENKIDGYVYNPEKYTIIVGKEYAKDFDYTALNSDLTTSKFYGRVKFIKIKNSSGHEIASTNINYTWDSNLMDGAHVISTNWNNNTCTANGITVKISTGTSGNLNIDISEKNDRKTGSYNIYFGKKSAYEDIYEETNHLNNEIPIKNQQTGYSNLAGAKFKVEVWQNDADPSKVAPTYQNTYTSDDFKWEQLSFNITQTGTDRIHITEEAPPDGYNFNKTRQIWIDVVKAENDKNYYVSSMNYSFRDENGDAISQYSTTNCGGVCSWAGGAFQKLSQNSAICVFQNHKKYSLNIIKRNKDNQIIESGTANFSIQMFTGAKFDTDNDTAVLSENIDFPLGKSIETFGGTISIDNLDVTSNMINKTIYYLVTENTAPNGYNSIDSLIIGIKFDKYGNSSLASLYHVKEENGKYHILSTGTNVANSSNLTVNVGNDGISANANSTNNIINIDIQQPDHEDSYYNLMLGKKDASKASDGSSIAGVKFKVSNVKINNSNINNNEGENAFSITSEESLSKNVTKEIYTKTDDSGKKAIGTEKQVLNNNVETDTYTIEEEESVYGYELNTIKTNLEFHKTKDEKLNIKNDYVSIAFDKKNVDGNYVSGEKITVEDGYFVSSLDNTPRKYADSYEEYIQSLKNEPVVIVYYIKGTIRVQYFNKLEGKYNLDVIKHIVDSSGKFLKSDSSIKFNIKLYKTKNNNNEFSDEVAEVKTEKGTVKLSDLTDAKSISNSLEEVLITKDDENKTYYYVLEETDTRKDLVKLDYKIVIPIKFIKGKNDDTEYQYVVSYADEKPFGLKGNNKIELIQRGLIFNNESVTYNIETHGDYVKQSLVTTYINNFEKKGNYNLKLLKIKAKDGFTADLLSQLKNANSINDLNALAKSGARFGVTRTTRGGSSVSESTQDITSEEGKVKDVYDGQLDINEDDMNFNPEYNEENGGDAKLDYGTSKFKIDEWSATGTGMKVNKAISNLEIETKLSRGTDKYSLTDVKVYDKTQNKEITADEAFTKYGLFVKIMNSEDGTPILITAVADDVITGEFSFNLKKVNSKTGKELTAEECNGMKFNFGLYQGGDSYDNPGTKVTELTKKDGTTVNISNLTTLQEINNAMSNIEITEEMNKQTTYRLIIEETEAPADFVKFNHKIGCTLISNQNENEEYKMIYTDFKVYDGKYWQYYSQYEEVDFDQYSSENTLTLTLKNVPKTGSYNLDVEKVDLSGNDIKDETTRFSVKAYSSVNKYGISAYEDTKRI